MKKLVVLAGVLALLTFGASAWADFTLTFDGSQDLTGGADYGTPPAPPDIIVTGQYTSSYGVTFLGPASSSGPLPSVTIGTNKYTLGGATFGTPPAWFDDNGSQTNYIGTSTTNTAGNYYTDLAPTTNFLGFNKSQNGAPSYSAGTVMDFQSPLTSISFQMSRPGANWSTSAVLVDLLNWNSSANTYSLVGTETVTMNSTQTAWSNVTSTDGILDPSGAQFNAVLLNSGTRFMIDNVTVSPTPIPNTAWLLGAAGLVGILGIKRRRLA
jgi:hypothetical protein